MKQKFYFDKKYFKTHTSLFVFGHLGSREKIKYEELKTYVHSSFLPHTVLDLLHRYHLFIEVSFAFIRVQWQQENHSLNFSLKTSPIKEIENHEENMSYDSKLCIQFQFKYDEWFWICFQWKIISQLMIIRMTFQNTILHYFYVFS